MTRALVTLATGSHERLLDIALPSFRAFASRHRYELTVATAPGERPASWEKIPALQRALQAHDEVLWVDADAIIVDTSDDLDVPAGAWHALVEHHTNCGRVPNCGVWLVRRSMLPILERIWGMTEFLHHGWWEQAAVLKLLGYQGMPVAPGEPTELLGRTHFLDAGWNVHREDLNGSERSRIMHATMWPDREAVMREWAASA